MEDLPGPDGLSGLLEFSEEIQVRRDFIALHPDNDETKAELLEVSLANWREK